MANHWNLPHLGYGIGLRTVHFGEILSSWPEVDFFEAITENFLDTQGRPLYVLDRVAERYPIVLHGVSLSIGSTDPLNFAYLNKVKALARRVRARWVTDHLCWTGVAGRNVHDLLPVPYTEEALAHIAGRARIVADVLEQPLFLENPSTYLEFAHSTMTEPEFLGRLCDVAQTGLLLDVNNVYVSAMNHGFDPFSYLDAIPRGRVVQFHMAGHTDKGTHRLDTHSTRPVPEVWDLYAHAVGRFGEASTLYEWDEDIPDLATVHAETLQAREVARKVLAREVAYA